MIAGEIAASRRAPGRVLCRIEVRNDLTGETTEFFAEERFSFRAEHCGRLTVRIRRAWLLGLPGLFARKIRMRRRMSRSCRIRSRPPSM